ncbi:MAG: hypothetical protein JSV96_15215 [Candidatus Aminicenantes bacterium]|nr:MAG: hypothetical protein JSV96_15215 [Candidatus Aminicenantes bacterium]
MKKAKNPLKITAILSCIFLLFSCNPLENETESDSLLVVQNITGTDIDGNVVNYLQSDVQRLDEQTGQPYITADSASAALKVSLLDPSPIAEASQYNSITINRYVVSYSRSDGHNTPGVDIPYSFEGSLSVLIDVGSTATIAFIIVREVAKIEPPLINLVSGTEEGVLQVTAKVDFYGQDLANNKVKATGYLNIFFANYTDN